MHDDDLRPLFDQLFAAAFTANAFMLEVALQLAKQQPDPEKWATDFISNLHSRVDGSEERMDAVAQEQPIHELSRQHVDDLGRALLTVLRLPPA